MAGRLLLRRSRLLLSSTSSSSSSSTLSLPLLRGASASRCFHTSAGLGLGESADEAAGKSSEVLQEAKEFENESGGYRDEGEGLLATEEGQAEVDDSGYHFSPDYSAGDLADDPDFADDPKDDAETRRMKRAKRNILRSLVPGKENLIRPDSARRDRGPDVVLSYSDDEGPSVFEKEGFSLHDLHALELSNDEGDRELKALLQETAGLEDGDEGDDDAEEFVEFDDSDDEDVYSAFLSSPVSTSSAVKIAQLFLTPSPLAQLLLSSFYFLQHPTLLSITQR